MAVRIRSKRDRQKVSDRGYEYVFDKYSADGGSKFWRCELKNECPCRIWTSAETGLVIHRSRRDHTHGSNAAKVEADMSVTAMKERAVASVEPTSTVINQCVEGIGEAARGALPNMDALRKAVRRKRIEVGAAPVQVATAAEIVLTDDQQHYSPTEGVRERFLLADSGEGQQNRILIFGRQGRLALLQESRNWYLDGTFSVAPPLFGQVYLILAAKYNAVHPVLYALLPNKSRATYDRLFAMVRDLIPNAHPQTLSFDFEVAAFQAAAAIWPMGQIFLCFFHLTKNLKRKLREENLLLRYENEADFALQARMIVSLAFVPINAVDDVLALLDGHLPAELQPILNWFEDSYVGRPNRGRRGGRQRALFPVEMWSLYDRVLNDAARTNNYAEAANRRLNLQLGVCHPTLWRLIDGLKSIQQGRDVFYESLVRGEEAPRKLKKYERVDERVKRLVEGWGEREGDEDKLEYLRGLAHNFLMNHVFPDAPRLEKPLSSLPTPPRTPVAAAVAADRDDRRVVVQTSSPATRHALAQGRRPDPRRHHQQHQGSATGSPRRRVIKAGGVDERRLIKSESEKHERPVDERRLVKKSASENVDERRLVKRRRHSSSEGDSSADERRSAKTRRRNARANQRKTI